MKRSAFERRHQAGVPASGRGVDAGDAFGREAGDIVRAAGLGAGSAQPLAAEWLAFDHGADLVAIDVEIADARVLLDIIAHRVDAALEAKRQPVARRVDILDNPRELIRGEADHVEDRTEILTIQLIYRLNLIKRGSNEAAVRRRVRQACGRSCAQSRSSR